VGLLEQSFRRILPQGKTEDSMRKIKYVCMHHKSLKLNDEEMR